METRAHCEIGPFNQKQTVSAQLVQLFRQYVKLNRTSRIFALTFLASAAVTAFAEYQAGGLEPVPVVLQSALVAALVAAVMRRMGEDPGDAATASAEFEARGAESGGADPVRLVMTHHIAESLEQQGITIKLLELIALGDRYGNRFSVAMIGIDHLEGISEQYDAGMTAQLLKKVSSAVTNTLRMPDRVGEYDHGMYLVVLPETRLPGAIRIAERLRGAISGVEVAVSHRVRIHTTASVGVTSYRRGDDLQSMLERAHKALREAQNQGRNRVLPDMAA